MSSLVLPTLCLRGEKYIALKARNTVISKHIKIVFHETQIHKISMQSLSYSVLRKNLKKQWEVLGIMNREQLPWRRRPQIDPCFSQKQDPIPNCFQNSNVPKMPGRELLFVFRSFCLLHTSCACILLVYQGIASGHGIKVVRSSYTSRVT